MPKTAKTYGYARRASVPDLPGTSPKRCPTCRTWFAAFPRQRVCYWDSTPARRRDLDKRITRTPAAVKKTKIKIGQAVMKDLTLQAAMYDLTQTDPPKDFAKLPHSGVSFGCAYPKEGQAEIVTCDQGRRHPYAGKRPQWSGYCVGPCACKCHTPEPGNPVQSLTATRTSALASEALATPDADMDVVL